jgi:hypothetical protein
MFYGVRLLASRPTPVNFGGLMIFCWGVLPQGTENPPSIPLSSAAQPTVHCPWTTMRRLRVWVCWQRLQVEYTGSFLVFNRACLLASACPTRAIPAFGPEFISYFHQIERQIQISANNHLIFYILYKKKQLNRGCIFFKDILPHNISRSYKVD